MERTNLIEVTKEIFFECLNKDKRDIMPTIVGSYPYISEWRANSRDLFGKSSDNKYWMVKKGVNV